MSKSFKIQFFRSADNLWCDSISAPMHDPDVDELKVWKVYVNYLSLAYPDVCYRLVVVTTVEKTEVIHV